MILKGDRFRIDWDKLIETGGYGLGRSYVEFIQKEKAKEGDTVFQALSVRKGFFGTGRIVTYKRVGSDLFYSVGECYAIKVR